MRFDWYAATVRDDRVGANKGSVLVDSLASELGATVSLDRPRLGYGEHAVLRRGGDVVGHVLHGGIQPWPNAYASGDASDEFVPALRTLWSHDVTRADAAQDFIGEAAWDRLYPLCLDLADERRLSVSQAGDWHRGIEGRTLYIGSRKSGCFARLYEKGKEQVAKAPSAEQARMVPADWVRLELECRPSKETRSLVSKMSPDQVFGMTAWSMELRHRIDGVQVPRVAMKGWRVSDDDRALAFMLRQYGPTLMRKKAAVGSWAALGELLGVELGDVL